MCTNNGNAECSGLDDFFNLLSPAVLLHARAQPRWEPHGEVAYKDVNRREL